LRVDRAAERLGLPACGTPAELPDDELSICYALASALEDLPIRDAPPVLGHQWEAEFRPWQDDERWDWFSVERDLTITRDIAADVADAQARERFARELVPMLLDVDLPAILAMTLQPLHGALGVSRVPYEQPANRRSYQVGPIPGAFARDDAGVFTYTYGYTEVTIEIEATSDRYAIRGRIDSSTRRLGLHPSLQLRLEALLDRVGWVSQGERVDAAEEELGMLRQVLEALRARCGGM
jgi:hypothetical protein